MAWIESHQELREHPKTKRLCRVLALPRPMVVGYLHFLWWWSYDYAADGDLSKFTDEDIADAIDWEGDPGVLVGALTQCGFLTEGRQIHDWEDFAQKWIERRKSDRERKAAARRKPDDVQEMSNGCPPEIHSLSGVTGPDHTGPNQTTPDLTSGELDVDGGGAGGADAPATATEEAERPKRKKRGTPVPEDFPLTEKHFAYAQSLGMDEATTEYQTTKFLDHHRFKGTIGSDWYAGWQNWLRDSIGRFAEKPRASPTHRNGSPRPPPNGPPSSPIPTNASAYLEGRNGPIPRR